MSSSSLQSWVSEHKLASVGTLWASAIGASLAFSMKRSPLKTSLKLIHARMHAQALTLAVLSSAAIMHYYDDAKRPASVIDDDAKRPVIAIDDDEEKLAHTSLA